MKRDTFGSRLGILAAAAGSAIGLGNIWKFPYITGKNGGAAFILVYLVCITLIGLPVMVSEFVLGRKTQANAVGAFKKIEPRKPWFLSGYLATLTAFIILSYYTMIAGWILSYIGRAATGKLVSIEAANLGAYFESIIGGTFEPLLCTFVIIVLTAIIVISGIKDGVEKYCKILMPVLLGLLILLMFRSLTLEGASKGIEFLFKPDFSQLTTQSVLEALGHSFFTLSLGMGIILTYGSYIDKNENIINLAIQVTIADTVIALMAGLVIFPAVFAYGLEPGQGAGLIFITLPAVFREMPFGTFFGALFFTLIGIAALTSTISLLEVIVSFAIEEFNMHRKKATILVSTAIFLLAIPSVLSFGLWSNITILGKTFFGWFDFLTSNVLLAVGGILVCIFVGWVWGTKNAIAEITSDGQYQFKQQGLYSFIIRFLAPAAILLILLNSTGILSKLLSSN
ncbi:sodium-dependent transporter [Paramaledivibacter caminithermalis]|jgi:NSS family neurotransmitter:Na+ symporter|uniref:Transporter n=1 Tax=Paramaledivibacter caminithermalis (strain DSM 15212 / CIP 107654 / DViRD3) TaxID=1121301 RepID=A0A1M6PGG8_PARC5|nr:sodium-dependent transporter [Paramaledivibacter caminithermalis]SHK07014.1 neurotransmitter:Na+ symporter, NSS family [Paramaledivibacter caminithermalis DSM 15212]